MMISLFGITDTVFTTNGDRVIIPLEAKVRKEDNGAFYLSITTGLEYADDLTDGRILVAPTPQGKQPFRISGVTKTRKKITAKCNHVFYDSRNYLITNYHVVDRDCNYALDYFNTHTEPTSPFTTESDVTTVATFYAVRKSLYETVQTVIERWGGHLVRDGFKIGVKAAIGQDNGVVIRYAKNLKEITAETNWDAVVTKLLPTGKNGIMLNEVDPSASVYVTSSTQYDIPYCKTISFSQDIDEKDYKNEDGTTDETAYKTALVNDLLVQATAYVEENSVPRVNYTLKANIDRVTDVGDTVEVIDERLGIRLLTNVIAFTYDCISGRYLEVEFGNFTQKLSSLVSSINASTEKTVEESAEVLQVTLGAEIESATQKLRDFLGKSYVIYEGSRILVVDRLPAEAHAGPVIQINSKGIGFSQSGTEGPYKSAWTIDNTLNMAEINVINLTANLIKGGTLKLGSNSNISGVLELYDEANSLIGELTKDGLKMYGSDGSYVIMNNTVGFAGFDRNGVKIYWVDRNEFHQRKSFVEEEITICDKIRFIPVTRYNGNNEVVNDGVAVVAAGIL